MSQVLKRLYFFTGKGGVGKTTLSFAFAKYLANQGVSVTHVTLAPQTLHESSKKKAPLLHSTYWIDVPQSILSLEDCAEEYIQRKLGSNFLGKWIVGSAFFRAQVNMLPGFGYLIYLGKILQTLRDNPEMTIIVDAPASGHVVTMLEAVSNFRDIFKSGVVFDDTKEVLGLIFSPHFTQINILSLPHLLSLQEATELRASIKNLGPVKQNIFLNYSLETWKDDLSDAPEELKHKLALEHTLTEQYASEIESIFPYSTAKNSEELYQDLLENLPKLQ